VRVGAGDPDCAGGGVIKVEAIGVGIAEGEGEGIVAGFELSCGACGPEPSGGRIPE
jgi:hypothetical protein